MKLEKHFSDIICNNKKMVNKKVRDNDGEEYYAHYIDELFVLNYKIPSQHDLKMFVTGVANTKYQYYRIGHELKDVISFFRQVRNEYKLNHTHRMVFYVNNLSFFFKLIEREVIISDLFAREQGEPYYVHIDGIELRDYGVLCTDIKTSVGDENLCGDIWSDIFGTFGDADFYKGEVDNVKNEVDNLCKWYEYYTIATMPMTKAAATRKICRKNMMHTKIGFTIDGEREYTLLKKATVGGFCAYNEMYQGELLENVSSYDLTSAYISLMFLRKYPMSNGRYVKTSIFDLLELSGIYCFVVEITIKDLECEIPFLSEKQISGKRVGTKIRMGKIVSAEEVTVVLTDVDFRVLQKVAVFSDVSLAEGYAYKLYKLPRAFLGTALDLYCEKAKTKGGDKITYNNKKTPANALFGITITDICQSRCHYDPEKRTWEKKQPDIDKCIKDYNENKNRFLFYPWGIFIASYCREVIVDAIMEVGYDKWRYSDTDCVKFEGDTDYFKCYNDKVREELLNICQSLKFDTEKLSPVNIKGERQFLGMWEYEGTAKYFKMLSRKCYAEETNGKVDCTVAGMSKVDITNYFNKLGIDAFRSDAEIPAEATGILKIFCVNEKILCVAPVKSTLCSSDLLKLESVKWRRT